MQPTARYCGEFGCFVPCYEPILVFLFFFRFAFPFVACGLWCLLALLGLLAYLPTCLVVCWDSPFQDCLRSPAPDNDKQQPSHMSSSDPGGGGGGGGGRGSEDVTLLWNFCHVEAQDWSQLHSQPKVQKEILRSFAHEEQW
eukprot:INCI20236.1.p1 GENE.INCI20236.1~~INCI20236.1.p1  ORF type:complete len:141 (-),score=16.87 INCI20236.1:476-898(-)